MSSSARRSGLLGSMVVGVLALCAVLRPADRPGADVPGPARPQASLARSAAVPSLRVAAEPDSLESAQVGAAQVSKEPETSTPAPGPTLTLAPGLLRVRVVDLEGRPLSGVMIRDSDTRTDANGEADVPFEGTPPQVEVELPWIVHHQTHQRIVTRPGSFVELNVTTTMPLEAEVVDGSTGLPLEGADVRIHVAPTKNARSWSEVTGAGGQASFAAIPREGPFELQVVRGGYVPIQHPWDPSSSSLRIELVPSGAKTSLVGFAFGTDGAALATAQVRCGTWETRTNASGKFTLQVPVGADLSDLHAYHHGGGWCLPRAPEPPTLAHEETRAVELHALAAQVELTGVVQDDSQPAPGARVSVQSLETGWTTSAPAKPDGSFRFLVTGTGEFLVRARGKRAGQEFETLWAAGRAPLQIDLPPGP